MPETAENTVNKEEKKVLDKKVYDENIAFWERAWGMCKSPYKQLPGLSYVERIPQVLSDNKVNKVLDLGCGSGWLSIYLVSKGFDVLGIDCSTQAINLGNIWAKEDNIPARFEVQDLATMDFPAGTFDAVVANSIFEHFPKEIATAMAAKVHAMLRPGGVFVGCFDNVGGGPGEYYCLEDGTHVYTDKARLGMLLRKYSDEELKEMFGAFQGGYDVDIVDADSRFIVATK